MFLSILLNWSSIHLDGFSISLHWFIRRLCISGAFLAIFFRSAEVLMHFDTDDCDIRDVPSIGSKNFLLAGLSHGVNPEQVEPHLRAKYSFPLPLQCGEIVVQVSLHTLMFERARVSVDVVLLCSQVVDVPLSPLGFSIT